MSSPVEPSNEPPAADTPCNWERAHSFVQRLCQRDRLLQNLILHCIVLLPPIVLDSSWRRTGFARVRKSHFQGTNREWYIVVAVKEFHHTAGRSSGIVQPYGIISHNALAYFNRRHAHVWSIPLILCQRYEDLIGPTRFDIYQHSIPRRSCDTLDRFRASFDTRMRVLKWLKSSGDFQARHPLKDEQLLYAGVNSDSKRMDTMVYQMLAFALRWVPGAKEMWKECESELLLFKLLLRPQLRIPIAGILGRPPGNTSLETAASSIEAVHEYNVKFLSGDEPSLTRDLPVMQLAIAYLQELVRWDALRAHEAINMSPSRSHALQRQQQQVEVLLQCSPLCMKRALCAVTGSTVQQSAAPPFLRPDAGLYLMKAGFEPAAVAQIMRPKVMIEYEMEQPNESQHSIDSAIRKASSAHARSKGPNARTEVDAEFAAQTCGYVMKVGLCPFRLPPSLSKQGKGLLSREQLKQFNAAQWTQAKQQCHAQLQKAADEISVQQELSTGAGGPTHKKRKVGGAGGQMGASAQEQRSVYVPREWATGPWMFAQQQASMRGVKLGPRVVPAVSSDR